MYYEEKVIDGILCWRNSPNGEWNQFTLEALTTAYRALSSRENDLGKTLMDYGNRLAKIQAIVNGESVSMPQSSTEQMNKEN